jgi:nucleotide-binding universal stress UspA family protein
MMEDQKMSIQTVTTILTSEDQMQTQLIAATEFARAVDAHLQVLALAVGMDQSGIASSALDAIPAGIGMEDSVARAKALGAAATAHLAKEDIRWNVEPFASPAGIVSGEIARHIRFSDLVVLERGAKNTAYVQMKTLAETVLFDADCPVLLLPEDYQMAAPPQSVMIAWDESAAGLRAARLALPLLTQARAVHVVLIDPPKDAPDRSDPGGAFAQFLSRQGIKCEVSVCNRTDHSIAGTLKRRATELDCDLLVMGAYGHSRLRQAVFGGTTRDMMEDADVPVFMAH